MVVNRIAQITHKGVVYLHDNTVSIARQARDDLQSLAEKRRSNDKIIPWMRKHLSPESLQDMAHCGDYLVMLEDDTRTKRKLDIGYFCRQRLCSGCAWRSAVKSAQCVAAIAGALADQGRIMIMVTLTVPNVPADKLRQTVQHINASWARLCKRQLYASWADHVRKLEITYNSASDTYHPHLHCVVFVRKGYFARGYISHAQLLSDWREVTRQPEITQVDVRRCRDRGNTNAILEVAKYSCKASDYSQSETVLDTMYTALHHTRTMAYAGRCKQLRTEYIEGRLAAWEEIDATRYTMRVVYVWQRTADAYAEHDAQAYQMDAAELARLQRDSDRLAAYAIDTANRAATWAQQLDQRWTRGMLYDWDDGSHVPETWEQVTI